MTNSKMTRRALLTSVMALILCFAMLTGTTFAWFTDQETSANNKIIAGNLDVDFLMYYDGSYQSIKDINKPIFGAGSIAQNNNMETLWEPGKTQVAFLAIENAGNLALKYNILVNVVDGGLIGALEYAILDGVTAADVNLSTLDWATIKSQYPLAIGDVKEGLTVAAENGTLDEVAKTGFDANNTEKDYFALAVHMKEDAGNEYMSFENDIKSITIDVTVTATQVMAEEDSFDNTYDQGAYLPIVYTAEELAEALSNGDSITLGADITVDESLIVPAVANTYSTRSATDPIIIDINGKKISGSSLDDEGKTFDVITNEGNLKLINGTVAATGEDGGATINNKGTLVLENVNVIGAPISATGSGYPAYCIRNAGNLTIGDNAVVTADRGCLYLSGTGETVINGGSLTNNDISDKRASFTSHVVVVGYGANNKLIINDGEFKHLHTKTSGGVVINNWSAVTVEINGGNFSGGNYYGKWDNLSDYGYGSTKTPFAVKGGTFTGMDDKFLAENVMKLNNADGTITVVGNTADSKMVMSDGAVLDLGGAEYLGTVVAEGDLTIKGDTKIKTLSATNGGTITIEDGKTLTLKSFSFGKKDNNTAEYTITGGTITANYGFFQHGKYDLYSNFETGYMYYSYGSDITVYGTFHSQGKGDGLDYVRGNLTIANGGKSIHDKSLWVGQPASWGAMSASLTVEEGGYVQANSLSVYDGSVAYNSAANIGKDNVGVKYNSLSGSITTID